MLICRNTKSHSLLKSCFCPSGLPWFGIGIREQLGVQEVLIGSNSSSLHKVCDLFHFAPITFVRKRSCKRSIGYYVRSHTINLHLLEDLHRSLHLPNLSVSIDHATVDYRICDNPSSLGARQPLLCGTRIACTGTSADGGAEAMRVRSDTNSHHAVVPKLSSFRIASLRTSIHQRTVSDYVGLQTHLGHLIHPSLCARHFASLCTGIDRRGEGCDRWLQAFRFHGVDPALHSEEVPSAATGVDQGIVADGIRCQVCFRHTVQQPLRRFLLTSVRICRNGSGVAHCVESHPVGR
mmetsp:Transcript_142070/g.247566  ORF Transcript_142070/g.247566 Transcript_142070/m.247566 type:complete len:293 (-) Transcript_142070:912-1790(-)